MPTPLTKLRSPWVFKEVVEPVFGWPCRLYQRETFDGHLSAIVGVEPTGWHMSISHKTKGKHPTFRYPTWDEIAHARYTLLPDDIDFVMHLPKITEYVDIHPTTFHLHEHPERDL
jgi:hypothetical protein